MKLSIIIVSYNTQDILDQCISSIKSSTISFSYEIIVVDNASHDGSVEMLKRKYPEVKLIENNENRLFAIPNNQGAEIATGEYIFLLNSDTIVYDDNIDRMVEYMDSVDKHIICVGPKVLNADKTLQAQGMHGITHWSNACYHFKLGKLLPSFIGRLILPPATYPWNCNVPHEVGWVTGCAMMIRRYEYIRLGGLNELLEFYGEEPEFSYRAKKCGYLTYYYPHAEIIHLGGASTKKVSTEIANENSLRRYTKIVEQTVGYKYAIGTSRITMCSYYLKRIFAKDKAVLNESIAKEKKIIRHFYHLQKLY